MRSVTAVARAARLFLRRRAGRRAVLAGAAACGLAAASGLGWIVAETGLAARAAAGIERAAGGAGLSVREVLVQGRRMTGKDALLSALDLRAGDPILSLDLADARRRVAELPWVRRVRVERLLPGTVFVRIEERRAMALWQRDGVLRPIDPEGFALPPGDAWRFRALPIVIGEGAPARAGRFLAMLASEPELVARVRAVTWVGRRRWDVWIDGRTVVRLPEREPLAAWARLARLERAHDILDRGAISIDMRVGGALAVRLAPGAAARQRARRGGREA